VRLRVLRCKLELRRDAKTFTNCFRDREQIARGRIATAAQHAVQSLFAQAGLLREFLESDVGGLSSLLFWLRSWQRLLRFRSLDDHATNHQRDADGGQNAARHEHEIFELGFV
jgi:hypothetical protein